MTVLGEEASPFLHRLQGPPAQPDRAADVISAATALREGEQMLRASASIRDPQGACERFDIAAREPLPQAWLRVGQCHAQGWGRPVDKAQAAQWYRRAAESGLASAQTALGIVLQRGDGLERDDQAAVQWFSRAAQAGDSNAALALARAYEAGQGVGRDTVVAAQWLQRAADQRNPAAQLVLAQWYLNGQAVHRSALSAYAWASVATGTAARISEATVADQLSQRGSSLRRQAAALLSADELIEGQRMSRDWAPGRLPLQLASRPEPDGAASTAAVPAAPGVAGASASGPQAASPGRPLLPGAAPAEIETPRPARARMSTGSGFFVSREGHLVTNDHVVRDCREVRLPDGQILALIARDPRADLALLRGTPVRQVARLRQNAQAQQGEEALTYGFPLHGVLSSSGQLGAGMVTALAGLRDNPLHIQIDVAVQSGNSGGPLIDSRGEVIGVVVSKLNALKVAQVTGDIPQNVNFAVALPPLKAMLAQHAVPLESGPAPAELTRQQVAEAARLYTTAVLCAR